MSRPALLALLALAACPGPATGNADAGVPEGADAGPGADAHAFAQADASTSADAAASPDAGSLPDAAAWDPALVSVAVPCSGSTDSVYLTPAPADAGADPRGEVVACAYDFWEDAPLVQADLDATGVAGLKAISGATWYRIAYRTTRASGPGVGTARVYLPDAPRPGPLPVVVAGHPTDGLCDACAPSKVPDSNRDLALPWAALGYPVIVPDYAGLGNDGTQGYLDGRDTAHSLLDAARALRNLLRPGAFEPRVVLVGYSQGGGAVLAAQALEKEYGAGGPVAAAIAFAAEYPTRLDSFDTVTMLESPDSLTIKFGITEPPVLELRLYAYFANTLGIDHAADGFPQEKRTSMADAIENACLKELGGLVQTYAPHVSDLMDGALRTSFLACAGDPAGAGCVEPGRSLHAAWTANELKADPAGAPVLYVVGLKDSVMPPAKEAACNVQELVRDGVTPLVCTDAAAEHTDVVERNVAFVIQWTEAQLAGVAAPACNTSGMPACAP